MKTNQNTPNRASRVVLTRHTNGPGSYRLSDHPKLGLSLNLLVLILSTVFTPFLWPF
jgi:hypothetical protein